MNPSLTKLIAFSLKISMQLHHVDINETHFSIRTKIHKRKLFFIHHLKQVLRTYIRMVSRNKDIKIRKRSQHNSITCMHTSLINSLVYYHGSENVNRIHTSAWQSIGTSSSFFRSFSNCSFAADGISIFLILIISKSGIYDF